MAGALVMGETGAARDQRGAGDRGLPRVVIALTALIGVIIRIVIMVTPIGRPDADEVIAGLMARHIGSDGLPLFFWGQHYGGALEVVPVALSLRLFGSSVTAMRVPGVVLAAGCSILVWRVATRVMDRRGAQLAGLLSWVGAAPAVWLSVREMLFYVPTVFVGLLAAVCAFRIREGARGPNRWGLATVLLIGVWLSPNIVYFAVPSLIVLVRSTGPALWARYRAAIITIAVTSAAAVLAFSEATTHSAVLAKIWAAVDPGGYPSRWIYFFRDGLPGLLGLREMFTFRWIGGTAGMVVYLLLAGVVGAGVTWAVRRRAWDGVGFVAFPFLFALVPKATDQPNMRYLFFAVPFVAMAIAHVATTRRWLPYAAIVVAVALTTAGLQRVYNVSEVQRPSGGERADQRSTRVGNVGDVDGVIAMLDSDGIDAAYGSYWVSFRVAFESEERIIAVQPWDEQRYQPYYDRVVSRSRQAWIVEPGSSHDSLRVALDEIGVGAAEHPVGDFIVVLPDRLVRPDELHGAVRTAL